MSRSQKFGKVGVGTRKFWKVGVGNFGKLELDILPPTPQPCHKCCAQRQKRI